MGISTCRITKKLCPEKRVLFRDPPLCDWWSFWRLQQTSFEVLQLNPARWNSFRDLPENVQV